MAKQPEVLGRVTHIDDFAGGSIVTMWVRLKKKVKGKSVLVAVHFDRRMFANMHEAEAGAIEGREVKVVGDLGNQTIEFLD